MTLKAKQEARGWGKRPLLEAPGMGCGGPCWHARPPSMEGGGHGRTAGSRTSSGLAVSVAIPHLFPSSCCPGLCLPSSSDNWVVQSHQVQRVKSVVKSDQTHQGLRTAKCLGFQIVVLIGRDFWLASRSMAERVEADGKV